jgi:hypothetical protein
MLRRNRELFWAFIAIIAITMVYNLVVSRFDVDRASSGLFGHSLGALGLLLMLMTETLYSLRKRSRRARWGRTASWLRFHIFTGLVGPYLAFLHTAWQFNGLAGVVMLMTAIVVASGFLGRYIYTALPRTADGAEVEEEALRREAAEIQNQLAQQLPPDMAGVQALTETSAGLLHATTWSVLGRPLIGLRDWWKWQQLKRSTDAGTMRLEIERLEKLYRRRQMLQRQVASLATARRMLAVWHTVHVPLGMALFTAVFIHVAAALYYATLLK